MRGILLFIIFALPCVAAPLKIMTVGDSLTDEYEFVADLADIPLVDLIFDGSIYPEPDSPSTNQRAFNWPELLTIRRGHQVSFGPSSTHLNFVLGFIPVGDLRFKGYEYNFAVVSTTSNNWVNLLGNTPQNDDFPFDNTLYPNTRNALLASIDDVDVIVIFLGGNDLKNDYDTLFNAIGTPALLGDIVSRLDTIHTFLRTQAPSTPIVVATVPDVGATPNVHLTYDLTAQQTAARSKIATMNQNIIDTFSNKPNTAVARVDNLTNDLLDIVLSITTGPYHLNGTNFVLGGHPFNPPNYLFCKDSFHPHTVGQALIANEIITAVNTLLPGSVTPFRNREILAQFLGLDPDQPYNNWVANFALTEDQPDDDPDQDRLSNLIEMLLGTPPHLATQPFTGEWKPGSNYQWTLSSNGERYLEWFAEESNNLRDWSSVPANRLSNDGSNATATPGSEPASFFRLRANPRP